MVLGVLYKLGKKCFEKKLVLLFGHENSFKLFSMGFNSFDVFERFLVFVLFVVSEQILMI